MTTENAYQADAVRRLQEATVFHVALSNDPAFLRRVVDAATERLAELQSEQGRGST